MPKKKVFFITMVTAILTLGMSISLQSLLAAWSNPTGTAPTNNVNMPIFNAANDILYPVVNGYLTVNNNFAIGVDTLVAKMAIGRVGIGTTSPASALDVDGEIKIGNSNAACNSAIVGAMRYNAANRCVEICDSSSWSCLLMCNGINNHIENGICTPNTKSCTITNGTGTQTWSTTTLTWGPCIGNCSAGYALYNGACSELLAGGATGAHTVAECTVNGGTIEIAGVFKLCNYVPGVGGQTCTTLNCVNDVDTNKHMVAWGCPSTWSRYQNWGSYSEHCWGVDWSWDRTNGNWVYSSKSNPVWCSAALFSWSNTKAPAIPPKTNIWGGTDSYVVIAGYDRYFVNSGVYGGAATGDGLGQVKGYSIMDKIGCY